MGFDYNIKCRDCLDCDTRSPMFNLLNKKELNLVSENKFEVTFKKGEIIRKQGTFLTHVISVNSGLVKLYLEGQGNKSLILRIIKSPSFIGGPGMYYDKQHHYTVKALSDTSVCLIEINVFKQIIHSNRNFADEFMKEVSKNLLLTYNRLISISQKQIPGKMADALLYLSDEIFDHKKIMPVITKYELMEMTGISKDSVTRILRKFSNESIIEINSGIEIIDREILIKVSNTG